MQPAALVMTEKWKIILNKNLKVGAYFMDLSKASDTLDHFLLPWKLSVYGGKKFAKVIRKLQNDFSILDKCFFNNFFVLKPDKCCLWRLEHLIRYPILNVKIKTIKTNVSQKLLEATIGNILIKYVKRQT